MITLKPRFTKEYCHPLKPNNMDLDYDEYTNGLFEQSAELFRELMEQRVDCMPSCLLFESERDQFQDIYDKQAASLLPGLVAV